MGDEAKTVRGDPNLIDTPFQTAVAQRRRTQQYNYDSFTDEITRASEDETKLGNILLNRNIINKKQYAEALIAQFAQTKNNADGTETKPPLGAVLVQLEFITPRQLYAALEQQKLERLPKSTSTASRVDHAVNISTTALSAADSVGSAFDALKKIAEAATEKLSG